MPRTRRLRVRWKSKTLEPGQGRLQIVQNSSLKKMMRAARRKKLPEERRFIIAIAEKRARERQDAYLNASPAKHAYMARQAEKQAAKNKKASSS